MRWRRPVRPEVVARPSAVRPGPGVVRSIVAMDTLVTVEVPEHAVIPGSEALVGCALGWFRAVESTCSRFDPGSELSRIVRMVGEPVAVSELLFHALEFSIAIAGESGGAFDPTVGAAMQRRGFDRNYVTRERFRAAMNDGGVASYRDVVLDRGGRTVCLARPLVLDLGAIAKGLALDLAAEALKGLGSYAVFAGGDLRVRGRNGEGAPWRVGVRPPREADLLADTLELQDGAVCTSGDYERTAGAVHHILRPGTGDSAGDVASVTVIGPTAMLADALATAAFVLGPVEACPFLERQGAEGLVITPDLRRLETRGFGGFRR